MSFATIGAARSQFRAPRPGEVPDTVLLPLLFVLVGAVTALDWFTGDLASPEAFYGVLILCVVWMSGPRPGFMAAATASISEVVVSRYGPTPLSMAPLVWNAVTHFCFYVVLCVLVIGQRRLFAERERLVTTDPLTGALNRRAFTEMVDVEILRAQRYRRPASCLYLDVDGLKAVNDSLGHAAGDALLGDFVSVLGTVVRSTDRVARLGGDEFAVFCPETSVDQAVIVGERILAGLDAASLTAAADTHGPTAPSDAAPPLRASIGVVGVDLAVDGAATLLDRADEAMYSAKRSGGHAVRVAGPTVTLDDASDQVVSLRPVSGHVGVPRSFG